VNKISLISISIFTPTYDTNCDTDTAAGSRGQLSPSFEFQIQTPQNQLQQSEHSTMSFDKELDEVMTQANVQQKSSEQLHSDQKNETNGLEEKLVEPTSNEVEHQNHETSIATSLSIPLQVWLAQSPAEEAFSVIRAGRETTKLQYIETKNADESDNWSLEVAYGSDGSQESDV
jgi:hypothetical protein